jgi:hypothetical protein
VSALSIDDLSADPRAGGELAARLDPGSEADRRVALDLAEDVLDRFMAPAAAALGPDGRQDEWPDLEAAAGTEVHGLSLGRLERRFPSLGSAPDDAAFAVALEDIGIEIPTPERRAAFLKAWRAQRAGALLPPLLRVVKDRPADPRLDAWELQRLRALWQSPLPNHVRALLEVTLQQRSGATP